MKAIESYVNKFFRTHKMSSYYAIRLDEAFACIQAVQEAPVQTIGTIFNYGYAKGYRAAMTQIKKRGNMLSNTDRF